MANGDYHILGVMWYDLYLTALHHQGHIPLGFVRPDRRNT
jgi:hypothetical protein